MLWSASDYCMVLNTFATAVVWPIAATWLIVYQMKTRKVGEAPIDVMSQLGQLKGLATGLQTQVSGMDQKVNNVAIAATASPVIADVPSGKKDDPINVETHAGLPTPEVMK